VTGQFAAGKARVAIRRLDAGTLSLIGRCAIVLDEDDLLTAVTRHDR